MHTSRMRSWRTHPYVAGPTQPPRAKEVGRSGTVPVTGDYAVRGSGSSYVVVNNDNVAVSRGFTQMRDAENLAAQLNVMAENRARFGETQQRPCMCCGRRFESEGIHNRLCDYCSRVGHAPANW